MTRLLKIHGISKNTEVEFKITENKVISVFSKHEAALPIEHSLIGEETQYLVIVSFGDNQEAVFTTPTLSPDLKDWF